MGWLMTQGQSRAQLIERRIAPYDGGNGYRVVCLKHALAGNCLWKVMETTYPDGRVERWIGLDRFGADKGYGWGYRDEEESMGPVYVSCPLSFLELVPKVASEAWRERVRAYHAERKRRDRMVKALKPGMRVRLVDASIPEVEIHKTKPLCGYYQGLLYRVPRSMLGEVIAED